MNPLAMKVTVPGEPRRTLMEVAMGIKGGEIAPAINPTLAWFGGYTLVPGTTSTAQELADIINTTFAIFYGAGFYHIGPEMAAQFLPGNPQGPPMPVVSQPQTLRPQQ